MAKKFIRMRLLETSQRLNKVAGLPAGCTIRARRKKAKAGSGRLILRSNRVFKRRKLNKTTLPRPSDRDKVSDLLSALTKLFLDLPAGAYLELLAPDGTPIHKNLDIATLRDPEQFPPAIEENSPDAYLVENFYPELSRARDQVFNEFGDWDTHDNVLEILAGWLLTEYGEAQITQAIEVASKQRKATERHRETEQRLRVAAHKQAKSAKKTSRKSSTASKKSTKPGKPKGKK